MLRCPLWFGPTATGSSHWIGTRSTGRLGMFVDTAAPHISFRCAGRSELPPNIREPHRRTGHPRHYPRDRHPPRTAPPAPRLLGHEVADRRGQSTHEVDLLDRIGAHPSGVP